MYDELVKRLREIHPEEFGDKWDFAFDCQQIMNEAADAIEELSARQEPKWIPVAEKLPKKMQYVLVRYQNDYMAVAFWCGVDERVRFWKAIVDEEWCVNCSTDPTHWMPPPQPPKEE